MLPLLAWLLTLFGPRVWTPPPVMDQGAHPWCAAYAVAGWLTSDPAPAPAESPGALFAAAQALEHDPPSGGTTMGAVLRVLQREGHAGPFWITQEPALARLWVELVGPIVLEGPWTAGMEYPDAGGAWHLTGAPWPRHAFFCYGLTRAGALRCQNSHGGLGRGTLDPGELAAYLQQGGYVALPLRPIPLQEVFMSTPLIIALVLAAVALLAAVGFAVWQPKAAARLAHDVAATVAQAVAADPALHAHVEALVALAYAAIPPQYRAWVSYSALQALAWDAIQAAEAAAPPVVPPAIPPAVPVPPISPISPQATNPL